jgi:hypothetical protein
MGASLKRMLVSTILPARHVDVIEAVDQDVAMVGIQQRLERTQAEHLVQDLFDDAPRSATSWMPRTSRSTTPPIWARTLSHSAPSCPIGS